MKDSKLYLRDVSSLIVYYRKRPWVSDLNNLLDSLIYEMKILRLIF